MLKPKQITHLQRKIIWTKLPLLMFGVNFAECSSVALVEKPVFWTECTSCIYGAGIYVSVTSLDDYLYTSSLTKTKYWRLRCVLGSTPSQYQSPFSQIITCLMGGSQEKTVCLWRWHPGWVDPRYVKPPLNQNHHMGNWDQQHKKSNA